MDQFEGLGLIGVGLSQFGRMVLNILHNHHHRTNRNLPWEGRSWSFVGVGGIDIHRNRHRYTCFFACLFYRISLVRFGVSFVGLVFEGERA